MYVILSSEAAQGQEQMKEEGKLQNSLSVERRHKPE